MYSLGAFCIHRVKRSTILVQALLPARSSNSVRSAPNESSAASAIMLFYFFFSSLSSTPTMPQGCLAYTDSYLVFFNSSSDSRSTPIYTASHSSIDIRFDGSANLTDFVLGQACAFYSPYVYLVGTAITSSASTGGDTQQHVVSTSSASPSPSSSVTTVSTGTSLNKRAGNVKKKGACNNNQR